MKTYQQWKESAGVNPASRTASICEGDFKDIQIDALMHAAEIARHAGQYASDHPGCQAASEAIMREIREPSNEKGQR